MGYQDASLIRKDQFESLKKTRAILVTQPHFVLTDFWLLNRVGIENANIVHPFVTIMKNGIVEAFSTDCPVEPLNPWETVFAAVTRGESVNIELARQTPDEKMDILEALDLYTRGSSYAIGEKDLGTLEKGKFADFIVLDRDPLKGNLRDTKVLQVYLGGNLIFGNKQG